MTKHIFTKSLIISSMVVFGAACTSAATEKADIISAAANEQGYSKPGADVQLRHNFSGKLNAGQVADFSVDLVMPPTDGVVSVSFTSTKGLDILSGASQSKTTISKASFKDGASPITPKRLQFRALEDGVYYVNAFIDVEYSNGQKRSRVITMPVNVGAAQAKPVNNGVKVETSSGRAIAVMDASETIEN